MIITNDLVKDLESLIEVHDVIAISGAPGIGKSEIAYQVAEKLGLKMLEVRLYEQGETAVGLPKLKQEVTEFSKPWWVKELEENQYDILFLDDFHLVPSGIQKFLYRLLMDRHLHNYKIPVQKIILAGNFDISSAGATFIQSPVMGRIELMMKYTPNIDNFMKWARKQINRFDTRVLAFLTSNADLLYEEDPAPTTKYPSPRTWEHLSRNISKFNRPDYAVGIVGSRAGARFSDFWEFLNKSPQEILKSKDLDPKEQVVAALVLSSEFTKVFKEKAKRKYRDQICLFVADKLDKDIVFLFSRYCYEQLESEYVDYLFDNPNSKIKDILEGLYAAVIKKNV